MASQNYDKLDLSTKVTWEHWASARGHFADVYKGKLADRIVAVKLLRLPEYNPYTKEDYEHTYLRFFREMTIWAELKHVNIVSMIGFTAAKGMIGLVSPWHENGNLVEYLAANPDVSVPNLMLDVAEGTRYLHETAHLAHGDLKGMNILIDQHGIARLTDFGISQQITDLNRHTGFTTTGAALGTTHWMAPEVLEGVKPHYHSDVYSCAGVFLEICARKCPFHYLSKSAIAAAKLRGDLPVRSHYPELDRKDGLWNLFCRCWDLHTSKRPTIGIVVETLYIECDLGPRPPNSVALRPVINRTSPTPSIPLATPSLLPQAITKPRPLYSPPVPHAAQLRKPQNIPEPISFRQNYPPPTTTTPPIPNPQVTRHPTLINLDQQTQGYTPSAFSIPSAPPKLPQGRPYARPVADSKTGSSYPSIVNRSPQPTRVAPIQPQAPTYPVRAAAQIASANDDPPTVGGSRVTRFFRDAFQKVFPPEPLVKLDRRSTLLLQASRGNFEVSEESSIVYDEPGMDALRGTFGTVGSIIRARNAKRENLDGTAVISRHDVHGPEATSRTFSNQAKTPRAHEFGHLIRHQLYDRPVNVESGTQDPPPMSGVPLSQSASHYLPARSQTIKFGVEDAVHFYHRPDPAGEASASRDLTARRQAIKFTEEDIAHFYPDPSAVAKVSDSGYLAAKSRAVESGDEDDTEMSEGSSIGYEGPEIDSLHGGFGRVGSIIRARSVERANPGGTAVRSRHGVYDPEAASGAPKF